MTTEQVTLRGQLTPQFGWEEERVVQAAREVEDLLQHPGWQQLVAAIDSQERMLQTVLLGGGATESGAHYADKLGEIKGVRSLVPLAEGVVEAGREVMRLRQIERQAEEAAREAA